LSLYTVETLATSITVVMISRFCASLYGNTLKCTSEVALRTVEECTWCIYTAFFAWGPAANTCHGSLIPEVSRSHTTTQHCR